MFYSTDSASVVFLLASRWLLRDSSYRSCTAYSYSVHQAASARKQSFTAANPLALGVGGVGPRSTGLQTPLGWLTGKLTGVGAR